SWYYFLANVITFAQTFIMRKVIDDKKIRAEIETHMKKPVKKSAFQQRLEEISKQKQKSKPLKHTKMKKITTAIFCFALTLAASITSLKAQDAKKDATTLLEEAAKLKADSDTSSKHWKRGGTVSINGQEVSLTNWAAGGQGAISVGGLVNLFFNYKKDKVIWNTNINLAYGVIKNGSSKAWLKTDDRIQLTSKVGREAFKKAYYSALFDFKTQFAPGYNYPNDSVKISNFMAPA